MDRKRVGRISRLVRRYWQRWRYLTEEQRDRLLLKESALIHAAARQENPELAKALLVWLAEKLRNKEPLQHDAIQFLYQGLIETALNPANAGKAFGLVYARKGKPVTRAMRNRNMDIVFSAVHLHRSGKPLTTEVIPAVADKYGISESAVRDVLKRERNLVLQFRAFLAENATEGLIPE